jgi:acylphosphatase
MKKRVHIYYSGMVQGVGFRFMAETIAGNLGLTGWVKNLKDGRVEVVAEGEETALNEFLGKIKKRMQHYISDADAFWQEATGEFTEFEVAFH